MAMTYWWLTLLVLFAALVVWASLFLNRSKRSANPRIVSGSDLLETLPGFSGAVKIAAFWRVIYATGVVTAVVSVALLTGRISSLHEVRDPNQSRDIVLCLDVSGSMFRYDTEILNSFNQLVSGFNGERVGLSIFNSSSRTVFPLTEDYEMVHRQLIKGARVMDFDVAGWVEGRKNYPTAKVNEFLDFVAGTNNVKGQGSLIGDGLASCSLMFDKADAKRERTIIFATDNQVNGKPIFQLSEAINTARDRKIKIFSLYPEGVSLCGEKCAGELRQLTEQAGGTYVNANGPQAIPTILNEIEKSQAESDQTTHLETTDQPNLAIFGLFIGMGLVILGAWRGRR